MARRKKKTAAFSPVSYRSPDVPDYIVAELRYESRVAIAPEGRFAAAAIAEPVASSLNNVLEAFDVKRVASHFSMPAKKLSTRAKMATRAGQKVDADFAQGGVVQIVPRKPSEAQKLLSRLAKHPAVWKAYLAPRPVPAGGPSGSSPGSRNFEPAQGYLHSAPNGIGAMEVWSKPGGKGSAVRICDIEGNWNLAHEDLPAGIPLIGGTIIPTLDWRNHGTAVLGEMVSRPGAVGTVGIAHQARAVVHSAVVGGVFNTAAAIMGATASLHAGDVILIELQAPSPLTGNYIAMQYWDDVFSAIRAATLKGITVVEAAGNGNENFDQALYAGSNLQKDSGAIVVGAGIPPTNFFDFSGFGAGTSYSKIGVPRSRIWFSNYGRIVNVQGWGWHVTTAGYGDAQGGASENVWYTLRFSGTSSASPIVTGSVAVLQGIAKASLGTPLTPSKVRSVLMATGTPQVAGPGVPLSQRIGPLPNLAKAITLI